MLHLKARKSSLNIFYCVVLFCIALTAATTRLDLSRESLPSDVNVSGVTPLQSIEEVRRALGEPVVQQGNICVFGNGVGVRLLKPDRGGIVRVDVVYGAEVNVGGNRLCAGMSKDEIEGFFGAPALSYRDKNSSDGLIYENDHCFLWVVIGDDLVTKFHLGAK